MAASSKNASLDLRPGKLSRPSTGVLSDLRQFLLRSPAESTLLRFESAEDREDYSHRILQRVGASVRDYAILNVHRIGIDCPVLAVFEELLKWDADSIWWPNHLSTVRRVDGGIDHIQMILFGGAGRKSGGMRLFELASRRIVGPDPADLDNARYLLYECRGGYPIGMFVIYVRSPIAHLAETAETQLFFAVSFDFYGKKNWSRLHPINTVWEAVHNRATANILNRFKQLQEANFRAYREGR